MRLQGTKKRHLPTSEFVGKFDCKADFMKYFKEHRKSFFILTFSLYSSALPARWLHVQQRFSQVSSCWREIFDGDEKCQVHQRTNVWWIEREEFVARLERLDQLHVVLPRQATQKQASSTRLLLQHHEHNKWWVRVYVDQACQWVETLSGYGTQYSTRHHNVRRLVRKVEWNAIPFM